MLRVALPIFAFSLVAGSLASAVIPEAEAEPAAQVVLSFDAQGAANPDPIAVPKGSTLGDVTLPLPTSITRPNYIPRYWSLTPGGAEAPLTHVLDSDTTLYLKWDGLSGVPYQVVYWVEKPNLGVNFTPRPGNPAHYNFAYSEPVGGAGTAGDLIGQPGIGADIEINSIPDPAFFGKEDPLHWSTWQATEPTVLNGDGTTIVNVYCELLPYRITFPVDPTGMGRAMRGDPDGDGQATEYRQGEPYVLDFQFGDSLGGRWPSPATGWDFEDPDGLAYSYWSHPQLAVDSGDWQTQRTEITGAMMPADPQTTGYEVSLAWTAETESVTMHYWAEPLPGQEADQDIPRREYDGREWVLLPQLSAAVPPTTDFRSKAIPGFQAGVQGDFSDTTTGPALAEAQAADGSWRKYANHYYRRLVSTLKFDTRGHGTADVVDDVPFGAPLAKYEALSKQADEPGWRFRGWFVDDACTLRFDFELSMPGQNLTVYALWESTDTTATFKDSDGSALAEDGSDTQGVQRGHTIDFANLTIGGQRYVAHETNDTARGALEGWDYRPTPTAEKLPFNADTPLQGDITLYARWQTEGLALTYHDTYGNVVATDDGGGPGYRNGVWTTAIGGKDSYCSTGREFLGWRISGIGAVYLPGAALQVFGGPHLYPFCPVGGTGAFNVEVVQPDSFVVSFLDGYGQVILSRLVPPGAMLDPPVSAEIAGMAYDSAKLFDGRWQAEGGSAPYDFTQPVTGNLRLEPVLLDSIVITFDTKGTPLEPLRVRQGAAAYEVAIPDVHSLSRDGFTPEYWTLDANTASPAQLPSDYAFDSDTTLHAVWTAVPDGLPYQVVYWVEKPNMGVNFTPVPGNPDHYDFAYAEAAPRRGTAGQTIGGPGADVVIDTLPSPVLAGNPAVVDLEHPLRWASWQYTQEKTLDGTHTVVNVYAALNTYRFRFRLYGTTMEFDHDGDGEPTSFTGDFYYSYKFGQRPGKGWPHPDNGAVFTNPSGQVYDYWTAPTGGMAVSSTRSWQTPRTVVTAAMMPADPTRTTPITLTLSTLDASGKNRVHLRYWAEETPELRCGQAGAVCREYLGQSWVLQDELSVEFWDVGVFAAKALEGLTAAGADWAADMESPGYDTVQYQAATADSPRVLLTPYRHFYYARNSYTLSYDMRGVGAQIPSVQLKYGYPLADYGDPAPDVLGADGGIAARFRGWFADANLTLPFDFGQPMGAGSLTVFAKWEATDHLLTFVDADGSPLAADDTDTQGVADGATANFESLTIGGLRFQAGALNDPVRGLFTGWDYRGGDGELRAFPQTTQIYKDYTLYAHWKTSGLYAYYHNPNGKLLHTDTGADGGGFSQGTAVVATDPAAEAIDPGCKDGQAFTGWRIGGAGAVYLPGAAFQMSGEPHLYAFCLAQEDSGLLVTLTYASNTGTVVAGADDADHD
ncbi:MAG: InlB B-repeat-containing protein, partial [Propionibacteriaceae bacterium]|nr:InlB B-repeat-containing protein [Propionibacteriaceae bacterium]